MITSFAQFLEQLQAKEAAILAKEAVKHGPTIGDMYEGLTRELVERAIPEALSLKLLDGFVVGVDGEFSHQTDAMLVMGESGRQIPKTDKWAWPIQDVLAVFEVKKNLYAADLADSIAKMRRISEQQKELLLSDKKQTTTLGPTRHAFAQVMGRFPRSGEMEDLENPGGEILRTIAHEQLAPLRIVFGYEGYADEYGLRNAFIDAIRAVKDRAAGPALLPNLIICRRNALIKLTGHPFVAPIREDGEWTLFGSTREAPFGLLLELLWTRLANQFSAQFPMDDTLAIEAIAPLLTGKPVINGQQRGWMFYAKSFSKAQLTEISGGKWAPSELSFGEWVLFQMATSKGGLLLEDTDLIEAAAQEKIDLKALTERLVAERLFAWTSQTAAVPVSETVHSVAMPDGRFFLSLNLKLLEQWIAENRPLAQTSPSGNSATGKPDAFA